MSDPSESEAAPDTATIRSGVPEVIAVAVIEDNRLVREGITALLNQVSDLRVVAGAFQR